MSDRPDRLQLDHVGKRYGERPVLCDVSLAIPAGAFVALVGKSGSGKTTLLKTINRLIEADDGMVRIDGADVTGFSPHALRRRIGYVFQGIGLFPHMTVAENIAIGLRLLGRGKDARVRVAELFDLVSLPPDVADRLPRALSGGQAQRVGFARALATSPAIMLVDEPFGALDPVTRDELGRAYRDLHRRLGLTTVMVTHDMTEALLLADRIVVLDQGRIRADRTPEQLMRDDRDAVTASLIGVAERQAARLAALGARG